MRPLAPSTRFFRYVDRVYDLRKFLVDYQDSRRRPRIPAGAALLVILIGLWTRLGSLLQMEQLGKTRLWQRVGIRRPPSADTLARVLEKADVRALRRYAARLFRQARYNKAFPHGTFRGWYVVAVDGSELYTTDKPRKAVGQSWSHRRQGERGVQYYVRAVALSLIGRGPLLALAMSALRRGEDEVAGARRLIRELDEELGSRWCDILVADALYAQAPFINDAHDRHKHVVIKVKQEAYHLVRDADGLFAGRPPERVLKDRVVGGDEEAKTPRSRYQVKLWDEEHFTSWEGVKVPLRCLRVEEIREVREGERWVAKELQVYHVVTTLPRALMAADVVWELVHRRWDIENSLFNHLTQQWAFTHCYTHALQGIEALLALYCVALNLQLLYAHRQLRRTFRVGKDSLLTLGRQLLASLERCRWTLGLGPARRRRAAVLPIPAG